MENLLGLVLSGGKSERMGSDKGLLPIRNSNWATHVAALFKELKMPFMLSINSGQRKEYSTFFPPGQLQIDSKIPVKGPLKGLLTGHLNLPEKDLFLMACDMIDMEKTIVQQLIEIYQENKAYDYFVYQHLGLIEPFCGIYTSRGLKRIVQQMNENSLPGYSLQGILATGPTLKIPISDNRCFKNYNYRSDLSL